LLFLNQKMSDNIKVCLRFRPVNKIEQSSGDDASKIVIKVSNDSKSVQLLSDNTKTFTFDHVFPSDSTQEIVFQYAAAPLIDAVLAGYNCTLFAYGQTGSGKTHTMEGNIGIEQDEGLMPRMIRLIFQKILGDTSNEFESTVRVSFIEIYNESLRDLLNPDGENLQIRDYDKSTNEGVYIENVFTPYVASPEEVFKHLSNGHAHRSVAATRMNEHSSRSHAVFILQLDQVNIATQSKRSSKLMMVDLAGSEKVRKTNTTGQILKEAQQVCAISKFVTMKTLQEEFSRRISDFDTDWYV